MDPRWCPVCLDALDRSGPCPRCGNHLLEGDALAAFPTEALIAVDEHPWMTLTDTPRGFVLRVALRSWLALLAGVWVALSIVSLLAQLGAAHGRVSAAGVAVSLAMLAGFGALLALTLAGEQTLTVDGDEATLVTRAGPLSWRERARWSGVRALRVERMGRAGGVHLDGVGLRFGQMLSARRQFAAARAVYPRLATKPLMRERERR